MIDYSGSQGDRYAAFVRDVSVRILSGMAGEVRYRLAVSVPAERDKTKAQVVSVAIDLAEELATQLEQRTGRLVGGSEWT